MMKVTWMRIQAMAENTRDQLQVAYQHLKSGEKAQAVTLLKPIVRADRDNADAWWLLANALEDPDKQRKALHHALDLRPDHAKAEQMLADLDAEHLPSIEDLVEELFTLEEEGDFWSGGTIFRFYAISTLVLAIAGVAFNVLLCVMYNLISDMLGGIRLTVIEEESARFQPPRRRPR